MLRATTIVRKAALRAETAVDTVTLDHAARKGGDANLAASGGLAFELALAKPATIEDGDALRLDDGRLVAVRAAEEALLEVRAGAPARLLRLAWQLGGNHVPTEVGADVLYVPAHPTIAEFVRGAGCTGTPVTRAFRPEREAHDHSQCGHDHHDDGHAGHDHQPHVHGPDCKHDH